MKNISHHKIFSFQKLLGWFPCNIMDRNLWLLLLSMIAIHFFILISYANSYHAPAQLALENAAHKAMAALIIGAAEQMPLLELREKLTTINNSKWRLGNDRLEAFLTDQPKKISDNIESDYREELFDISHRIDSFHYQLSNKKWINFFVIPVNTFYKYLVILLIMEAAIMAFTMFYVWTIHRFTRPLKKFKASAERLGIDLNAKPLAEYGPSLVRETTNVMNKMQERIQDLISTRTQMLAAISHDLHTPITRIRLRVELMEGSDQTGKIIQDLEEMEAMIAEVLSFSRNDVMREKKIWLDFDALVLSVCHNYADRGYAIHFQENTKHMRYFGCPVALKRMLVNLIENAVKYAGAVWIKRVIKEHEIIIIIEDAGPGISEIEFDQVFKPYYRSKSVTTDKSGTGLGLAIVQQVVVAHSGEIGLENRAEGGLRVTVTLPIDT